MAVGDAYVLPGFLTPVLTQLLFPKPPTTFLTCFCRGERRTYAGKKSRLNRGSNSQPPGHQSDTLTTEPPGRGTSEVQVTAAPISPCRSMTSGENLTEVRSVRTIRFKVLSQPISDSLWVNIILSSGCCCSQTLVT